MFFDNSTQNFWRNKSFNYWSHSLKAAIFNYTSKSWSESLRIFLEKDQFEGKLFDSLNIEKDMNSYKGDIRDRSTRKMFSFRKT